MESFSEFLEYVLAPDYSGNTQGILLRVPRIRSRHRGFSGVLQYLKIFQLFSHKRAHEKTIFFFYKKVSYFQGKDGTSTGFHTGKPAPPVISLMTSSAN